MPEVVVQPTQWSELEHMDSIRKDFSEKDAACLADIRKVLAQHDALDRFGVMLLHKHFDLASDECLLEEIDAEARTLTVRPVQSNMIGDAVQTQWRLSSISPLQWCESFCNRMSNGDHRHGHQKN